MSSSFTAVSSAVSFKKKKVLKTKKIKENKKIKK